MSKRRENPCEITYIMRDIMIVRMLDINVEKKNTNAKTISSFRKVKMSVHIIRALTGIPFIRSTQRNNSA